MCAMGKKPLRTHCAKSTLIAVGPVNVNAGNARNEVHCALIAQSCGRLHLLTGPWGTLQGADYV